MNIVITGASNGIGQALAEHYAAAGVCLGLMGRDAARLDAVARECRRQGAMVEVAAIDVTDRSAMKAWLEKFDGIRPVDLLIANAGISTPGARDASAESLAQADQLFAVNISGVLNTIDPILPRMQARGRGQVALMSSLAGYRGVAGAPAYAASKGFVRMYGEGLRGALAPRGIQVSTICPGFVDSGITRRNDFPMPFFMETPKAARIIAQGLARNRGRIAFPVPMVLAAWVMACLPAAWADWVGRRLPAKN